MATVQQTNGALLEFALFRAFQRELRRPIEMSVPRKWWNAWFKNPEHNEAVVRRVRNAIKFLIENDNRLSTVFSATSPTDASGDVRDILLNNGIDLIGISAKNNSDEIKGPRINSRRTGWGDYRFGRRFLYELEGIYTDLRNIERAEWVSGPFSQAAKWLAHDINHHPNPHSLVEYILGKEDYYQVKADDLVTITSFNFNGTMKWGKPTPQSGDVAAYSERQYVYLVCGDWTFSIRFKIGERSRAELKPSIKLEVTPFELTSTKIHLTTGE